MKPIFLSMGAGAIIAATSYWLSIFLAGPIAFFIADLFSSVFMSMQHPPEFHIAFLFIPIWGVMYAGVVFLITYSFFKLYPYGFQNRILWGTGVLTSVAILFLETSNLFELILLLAVGSILFYIILGKVSSLATR